MGISISGPSGSIGPSGPAGSGSGSAANFPANTFFVAESWSEGTNPSPPIFTDLGLAMSIATGLAGSTNIYKIVVYPGTFSPGTQNTSYVNIMGDGNEVVIDGLNWTPNANSIIEITGVNLQNFQINSSGSCTVICTNCIISGNSIINSTNTDTIQFNTCSITPNLSDILTINTGTSNFNSGIIGSGTLAVNSNAFISSLSQQGVTSSNINVSGTGIINATGSTFGNVTLSDTSSFISSNCSFVGGTTSIGNGCTMQADDSYSSNKLNFVSFFINTINFQVRNSVLDISQNQPFTLTFNGQITLEGTKIFASGVSINFTGSTTSCQCNDMSIINPNGHITIAPGANAQFNNSSFICSLMTVGSSTTTIQLNNANINASTVRFGNSGTQINATSSYINAPSVDITAPTNLNNSNVPTAAVLITSTSGVTANNASFGGSVNVNGSGLVGTSSYYNSMAVYGGSQVIADQSQYFTVAVYGTGNVLQATSSTFITSLAVDNGATFVGNQSLYSATVTVGQTSSCSMRADNSIFRNKVTVDYGSAFIGDQSTYQNQINIGQNTTSSFQANNSTFETNASIFPYNASTCTCNNSVFNNFLSIDNGSTFIGDQSEYTHNITVSGSSSFQGNNSTYETNAFIVVVGSSTYVCNNSIFNCTISVNFGSTFIGDQSEYLNNITIGSFTASSSFQANNSTFEINASITVVNLSTCTCNNSVFNSKISVNRSTFNGDQSEYLNTVSVINTTATPDNTNFYANNSVFRNTLTVNANGGMFVGNESLYTGAINVGQTSANISFEASNSTFESSSSITINNTTTFTCDGSIIKSAATLSTNFSVIMYASLAKFIFSSQNNSNILGTIIARNSDWIYTATTFPASYNAAVVLNGSSIVKIIAPNSSFTITNSALTGLYPFFLTNNGASVNVINSTSDYNPIVLGVSGGSGQGVDQNIIIPSVLIPSGQTTFTFGTSFALAYPFQNDTNYQIIIIPTSSTVTNPTIIYATPVSQTSFVLNNTIGISNSTTATLIIQRFTSKLV
jgi:hypothetical protein